MARILSQHKVATHLGVARRLRRLRLDAVPDPRGRQGRRHRSFASLLMTLILGLVSNQRTRADVAELSADLSPRVRLLLDVPDRISSTRLRDTLLLTQVDAIRCRLHEQVKTEVRRGNLPPSGGLPFHIVALDGKYQSMLDNWGDPDIQKVQPSGSEPYGLARVLNTVSISMDQTICLDVSVIPGDTNEIGHAPTALNQLFEAYGATALIDMIMADGGNASAGIATQIDNAGKAYTLRLTEMQGGITVDARTALNDAVMLATRTERRDGQRVTYNLYRVPASTAREYGWGHLRQWLRIEKITASGERTFRDWASNLPRNRLTDEQWLEALRRYWRVENGLHHVLDSVWREDAKRSPWIREGRGVLALAVLRRLAFNVLALMRVRTEAQRVRGRPMEWGWLIRQAERMMLGASAMEMGTL